MEGENTSNDLQRLLVAIKSSEVVECRTELINQLGELNLTDKSDLVSLFESLTISWEDSTCMDVSQCMLNKTILHVAAKYLEKDTPECLEEILSLGTKASIWCTQHFSMSFTSNEGSQEEHSSVFFQLVLDLLGFSAASFSVLIRLSVSEQTVFMTTIKEFISKQLNLIKVAISEVKIFHSVASGVLKLAQEVINAAVNLYKAYHQALDSESHGIFEDGKGFMNNEKISYVSHVTGIATCTVDNLYELGVLAAAGGGSLVMILNVSWKGLVTLLQLNTGDFAAKVNVTNILLTLLSLATESLKCAAKTWSSTLQEVISLAEAKRTFLPVKFYLINAVRVLSHYPREACTIYKELTLFCLTISTFGSFLRKETHLKASSEALTELLEPTLSHLLHTLLNSVEVKEEFKLEILDWLFADADDSLLINSEKNNSKLTTEMNEIFVVTCETMSTTRTLILGRIVLFLNLLRSSYDLGENARLGISRKLGWLFHSLIEGDVYPFVLDLHIPMLYGSGSALQIVWQPMFRSILHALKTFMVVSSPGLAWEEVETFLLVNFLHPHFFLREIVLELWCFFVRHAEIEMVNEIIDKLCSLLKSMASSEPVLMSVSALRKMARSICVLLTYAPQSIIDQAYSSIVNEDKSSLSSIVYVTLLIEGFPLNLLSEKLKRFATQRIMTGYHSFMETNSKRLVANTFATPHRSNVLGGPVYALASALRCLKISHSDIDAKTLKFTLSLIHGCRSATESLKDPYCKLLNQTLRIISNMKHLYAFGEMEEVILELQSLFDVRSVASNDGLYQCKPDLALFMAGVGEMKIAQVEGSPMVSAVYEIYHMLLRERHWAFVHSAISAFGYFASLTTCTELWRFVPDDAALSFDINTGTETKFDNFMNEVKIVLEKEAVAAPWTEQLALLAGEALILKESISRSLSTSTEYPVSDVMEIDEESQVTKKRKLPDEISEGMTLLHSGLKIMGDGLCRWRQQNYDSSEFQNFSTHLSRLGDVIAHLASFTERK